MKRNIKTLGLLLCISILPLTLFSQTVEEIIDKHLEAHGGINKWDKVDALEIKGNFTGFSEEKPFHAYKTESGKYYAAYHLGEFKVVEAFDGEQGWTIDPWQDIFHARKINKAEKNVYQQKAAFFTPFYKYKEAGHKVKFTGTENVDGLKMLVLELTRANGKKETWFLHPETYLEHSCITEWVDFGWANQAETYFDDFREVEGLIVPFFIDRTFGQRNRILQVNELTVNPEIQKGVFEMPQKAELKQLEFLTGTWDVDVEVMTRRGSWYPLGKTTSSIKFCSPMMLEENIEYERILPVSRSTRITYHDQSKSYRVSIFNELMANLEFFQGTLSDTSFVFENTGINIGEIEEPRLIKGEIIKKADEGFTFTLYSTNDKGETWTPTDRFTYSPRKE